MNFTRTCLCFLLLASAVFCARAQLTVVPNAATHRVFGGGTRIIPVLFHNPNGEQIDAELGTRLLQASSATVARVGESNWKKLHILPGQTIVEAAEISFPSVRTETRFLIQWLEGASRVLGTTEFLVYPTNLLAQLKALAGDEPLGVFDPGNQLKPLLKQSDVSVQDLAVEGIVKFHGKLAIFGPFESTNPMRGGLANDIRALAKCGVAIVWLQPPPAARAPLQPSFYIVRIGMGAIAVAQAELILNLRESPQAQLNLIHLAEWALHPAGLDLPKTEALN